MTHEARQRPEAVVFDLGKVLVDFDYGIAARRLAARGRLGAAEVQRLIDQSPLLLRYETGLMTRDEFFGAIVRESGFVGDLAEFAGFFADVFTAIPRMIALQMELRRRGIPTFIFSNTNDLAVDHIRRHFPFFSGFEAHVLSYEHRSMKPEARIYEVVEAVTGRRGAALLYIDDRGENIDAGAARGWQTILHRDPAETISRVEALGLIPGGAVP